MLTRFSALILAAGESRRFGGIKQLVDIQGETLLNRVIQVYKKAGFSPIYVALGANIEQILPTLSGDVKPINVGDWDKGMGYSLSTAIYRISQAGGFEQDKKLIIGAADQVDISCEVLTLLVKKANQHPSKIIAASYNQIHGVPAIFGQKDKNSLCELTGDMGARAYIKHNMCRVIAVETPSAVFDIDTKEDLCTWQKAKTMKRPTRINND